MENKKEKAVISGRKEQFTLVNLRMGSDMGKVQTKKNQLFSFELIGKWIKNRNQNVSDIYEGGYMNNKRCGKGIFKWASGDVYKGEYFDDLRDG